MNSKTIKKPGNDKKYLRKDKNHCLLCKSHKKVFFNIQSNSKNWSFYEIS